MKPRQRIPSKIDDYQDTILAYLSGKEQEFISAAVIYEKLVEQVYTGSLSLLQKWIRRYKKAHLPKGVLRYETLPGEQAQVDWGEKKIRDEKTGQTRKIYIFCMTLSWSRMRFVHFVPKADMYHFLICHKLAFTYFGGLPREILYDQNLCVLVKPGFGEVAFNKKMLDFSHHYGFVLRVCKPYRAQTKGKVENLMVKYVKQNFLSIQTTNRVDILNQRKRGWLDEVNQRVHSTTGEIPLKRLVKEGLTPIDEIADYDVFYLETRKVFNDATFSFQSRRYSVPVKYIGKFVTIKYRAQQSRIDVYFNEKLITQHRTDGDNWGQYVIKRSQRREIWNQWRYEKCLFYEKRKKSAYRNHPLSVYEEVAAAEMYPEVSRFVRLFYEKDNIDTFVPLRPV